MSKCTHITIVTALNSFRIGLAELHFIFLWVVEFLDSVMGFNAVVPIRTFIVLTTCNIRAYLACISAKLPPSILLCFMVKETFLRIMLIDNLALLSLKVIQVDKHDYVI